MDRIPPYCCAITETIANIANHRILKWQHPGPHKLDRLVSSPPSVEPSTISPDYSALPATAAPEALPPKRDPLLPQRQRILAAIDVFVDDFIGAAQGTPTRLNRIRRILMEAIDDVFRPLSPDDPPYRDVFRPLSPDDPPYRREPISVKKRQGDAAWSTIKKVLGWVVATLSL
jgi:hypothetical protein